MNKGADDPGSPRQKRSIFVWVFVLVACSVGSGSANAQTFGCNPAMANDIVCENSKTGNPSSTWDIPGGGAGDSTIQGFATDISVNQGQTIFFKINTTAVAYTIDIYRIGYYNGMGARKIVSIAPSAQLPQVQPACLTDSATNLADCGNWGVSASWQVPSNATSGVYVALLTRTDTGGKSHIVFIVRNDASHSAILYQTSDTTWQAYNAYGGHSLYGANDTFDSANRAFKVSYNRPFITRGFSFESATWLFGTEYPMIRWLEANGYDVTYFTDMDADRHGSLILNHKVYMDSGHDEYVSGQQRANMEAARKAGVNLAFFSGNSSYWKTRWENSIDGSNTTFRTLVCYKETWANKPIDPLDPPTWTGTWRDPRFSPPADGGRPENSLSGTIFMVDGPGSDNPGTLSIQVPAADGKMRFWRNTSIANLAAGQTATLPAGTLGYEWDEDLDNGSRPAGLFDLSTATYALTTDLLLDNGNTTGAGTATHHVTTYRAASGALVFSTGTIQWSWGLDSNHDNPFGSNPAPDPDMQQATVNLFADMGVQPGSLQGGLLLASQSTDTTPPVSTITSPAGGSSFQAGNTITISGTATDSGGGVVAGVEVSTDGGTTWHPASGRANWSYSYSPASTGTATIKSRAVDDSGNLENPSAGISLTVTPRPCPCTIWPSSTVPKIPSANDSSAVEVGVKFTSDVSGNILGVRFYKGSANTGTHIGNLWTSSGTLLATATFTNESASGWQQVNFSAPVAISANTVYVASYHTNVGGYSVDQDYFATSGFDDPPLHALKDGASGGNAVYALGANSAFPNNSFQSDNYWVDVVFNTGTGTLALSSLTLSPASVTGGNPSTGTVTLNGPAPNGGMQVTLTSGNTAVATVPSSLTIPAGATSATFQVTTSAVTTSTSVTISASGSGTASAVLTVAPPPPPPGQCPCTIWPSSTVPAIPSFNDPSAVEVGVKFTSDLSGNILGVRFYKGSANTGTHIGNLWSSSGALLATATFTNESASGWQQVNFSAPVAISANTVYVASYHTNVGGYSVNQNYFATSGFDAPPLHALKDGASGGNGVYAQGASAFPTNSFQSDNYWIDVVFNTNGGPATLSSVTLNPASVAGGSPSTGTVTLSGPAPSGGAQVSLSSSNPAASVPSNVTVSAGATTATFTVTTSAVTTSTAVTISASYGGATQTATLTVTPLIVSSLTLNPTTVVGGPQGSSTGTVALNGPAPSGGAVIALSSNNAAASVPANVTVPAGATSATFTVSTSPVITSTSVTISASYGGATQTATLTVTPPTSSLSSVAMSPASVTGGNPSTGTATMNGPSPSGGSVIALSSNNAAASVPASVTVPAGATSATFTVSTSSVATSTSVTISASYSGATQTASLTVTPPPPPPGQCPCTIWPSSTVPAIPSFNDPSAVEVGVKFTSDLSGNILGVRFYKGSANTGTHVGNLWDSTGKLLATATFTNETASGWQQVNFSAPVAIVANTVYVASYHTNVGGYSVSQNYFATSGFDAPPLHALKDGASGGDGVYAQGASAFPTNSFQSDNYWIDVVFNTNSGPATLSSVTLNPASVTGGNPSTGTVTLNASAPSGGAVIALSSNNAAASVPANVTVPAGATSATFTVSTSPVATSTSVTISASYGGATQTATLTVTPPTSSLSSVAMSPASVTGGNPSTGTATMNGPAPSGGAVIALSSNNAAASVPANVTVPAGATSATFTVTTSAVATSTSVTISAAYGPGTQTASLTVVPPVVSSLSLSPTTLTGGASSPTGTVTLNGPAPSGGAVIALSSNNAAANVPANVTVPAGATSATFTVSSSPVAVSTSVTVSASYGGATQTATLTVIPPVPASLSLSPASVTGGTSSPTGTVTLNGPAPSGGAVIALSSNNAAANVPGNVTVPAGATSATFTVTTRAVAASTSVTISATYGGGTQTASLTVVPPIVSSLTLSPTSVTGGTSSPTGTVTLNGPAPSGGAVIALSSSNAAASVPPSGVTVPAGATSATFTLTTNAVSTSTSVTISASYGGGTQTATLTVIPPIISSLTLNPTSVMGGLESSTGTVTLNGPAPSGGAVVSLSTSNAAANVPATVTVPAGATGVSFTVTTNIVLVSTTVTISASYDNSTKSATLTVTL